MPQPKKNAAYTFTTMLASKATPGFQANPTLATGDVKVSIDGGAFANLATLPVVEPAGSRRVKVALSAAEMNGDLIDVQFVDAAGDEWQDLHFPIAPLLATQDEIAAYVDTEVAAIKAKTDNLPSDPADASDIAASFTTINGKLDIIDDFLDTEVAAIKAKTDLLSSDDAGATINANLKKINGNAGGIAVMDRSLRSIVDGVVGAGATTAVIPTSSLSPAAVGIDQFKGLTIKFDEDTATTALRGQGSDILGNTAGGILTVTPLTVVPASGDTFTIL